ncbi:hypothetical protein AGMMS50256_33470 [Betaproteobacteria bacterium]|nr:hypothetical protein AGMMS50256_33470 [Betaproteobacteria bacterium]
MPEGQERGRRFSTKQGWNRPDPPPLLPLPGHPLPQGERESKRLFMLYHDKYIHAMALEAYPLAVFSNIKRRLF